MAHHDTPTDPTEPAGRQPRSLQKPEPSTAGEPAWALTELTRNAISSSNADGHGRAPHGIEWVRPTDLVHRVSADLMTRGADAHREAHAWARTRLREAITPSHRRGRLPPPSAFGTHGPAAARRDAMGR
jgi:hypothetical protein